MWWNLRLVVLVTAGYLVSISATNPTCKKSFPSGTTTSVDELLMKVFYLVDPDPDTAYIYYSHVQHSKIRYGYFSWNNWKYTQWLAKEHDAKQSLINLWIYLARCAVTDYFDIHTHYKYFHDDSYKTSRKPNGLIDFAKLKNTFSNACQNYNSLKNTWPFNCMDEKFFCQFTKVFPQIHDMMLEEKWQQVPGSDDWQRVIAFVTNKQLYAWSELGVDDSRRAYILEYLFHEDVLKYIPQKFQTNVFYESQMAYRPLKAMLLGKVGFAKWTGDYWREISKIENYAKTACSQKSNTPVAKEYYCRVHSYITHIHACEKLEDPTPCVYDPMVLTYFSRGRFNHRDEHPIVQDTITKTRGILTPIKVKTKANDLNYLKSTVESYSKYIKVRDDECTPDWQKAFNWRICGSLSCTTATLYRFDCILKFVLKQTKQLVDLVSSGNSWTDVKVKNAKDNVLIWLSYLPMAEYATFTSAENSETILSTQKTIQDLITRFDATGLARYSSNWPSVTLVPASMKKSACQTTSIQQAHVVYCVVEPLLHSVFLFVSSILDSKKTAVRVLNPVTDYKTLIEQLQLERIKRFIVMQTESYFNDISHQLQANFGKLSEYFSSLANFDKKKAEADIGYIYGRLGVFNKRITDTTKNVENMFSLTLKLAIGANAADLAQKVVQLGVAIAKQANPASEILGGGGVLDLMDAINDLAQAGVETAKLIRIGTQDFPILIDLGSKLGKGFAENAGQQKVVKELIDGLKNKKPEMDTVATTFLDKYNSYAPKVLRSDITSYGAKWETVSVAVCEAAFAGSTAASALVEIGIAAKGDCIKISSEIAKLITVYEELYDYQFDLMDSLAAATRAYLAYEKANAMKSVYTSGPKIDKPFLSKMAVNTFIISTMHVWQVVTEYCDILTYTSGGTQPPQCTTALQAPSHHAVAQVLAHSPPEICRINNEFGEYRTIPVKPKSQDDKAYIDLEKLYKGEAVTFQIPNFQWLKDHGWVGAQEPERVLFLKSFELILPPMSLTAAYKVEILVEPDNANYLRKAGTKYLLPLEGYTTAYTSNSHNCYGTKVPSPYSLCKPEDLAEVCYISRGTENRYLQPTILTKWTIKVLNLPLNEIPPKPATNFKLQAGISYCRSGLITRKKRSLGTRGPIMRSRRGTQHCCAANQYWNGKDACVACPSGTSQKMKGYYCQ